MYEGLDRPAGAPAPGLHAIAVGRAADHTTPTEAEGEQARLDALRRHRVLDTPPERAFDDLTALAAQLCGAPMALVSMIDADRQWNKSRFGIDVCVSARETSFCAHTIRRAELLVVPDTTADARFATNPFVTGEPGIRFYAGAPLTTPDGHTLGALCVLDTTPRVLSEVQLDQLRVLARQVTAQLTLRRQAAELEESRRVLDGVVTHSDSPIYVKDLAGRFTLANPAVHTLFGLRPGSIVGRTMADLVAPDIAAAQDANDAEVARTGIRTVFPEHFDGGDGDGRDFLAKKFPLRDEDGVVYAVAGVSTDVTDMADQRRQLVESEQRWRELVEHSPVAVAVIGADARLLYANDRAVALYGGPSARSADVIGRAATDFVVPGEEETTAALFHQTLGGTPVLGCRWRLARGDGALIDVELNAAGVAFRGRPAVQVELRDMTVQVAAEQVLRESERRWRAIFTGSPVGIAVSDHHGQVVEANEALFRMLGRSHGDVVGRHATEFLHPDDDDDFHDAGDLDTLAGLGGVRREERRYVRPDGGTGWAWVSLASVPGPHGEAWTLAHIQDVTDRRAAEQAVAESEANLMAVSKVAQRIQAGGDARQTIVDAGLQLADASYVGLTEPDQERARLRVTAATDPALLGTELSLGDVSLTATVYRTGVARFLAEPASDPVVSPALLRLTRARSVYVVPIAAADAVTGVLVVGWDRPVPDLDDRRAAVITLLAAQAGSALRQAGLVADLEVLATTDPLTALPNRRGWDQVLRRMVGEASGTGRPVTVAIADIDHFKRYNDTWGHVAGDGLLREVGVALRGALRRADTAARWGGEEFALILPDCTPAEAVPVLERVLHAIPQNQTCSIGYATWTRSESVEALMARADEALYRAKTGGRNRMVAAGREP